MLTGQQLLVLVVVDNVEEDVLLVKDVLVTDATNLVGNVDAGGLLLVDAHFVKHII